MTIDTIALVDLISDWAVQQSWDSEDPVSSLMAETNTIFSEIECDDVELHEIDENMIGFTCSLTLSGEPRKDDVPFLGDTIYVRIEGHISREDEDHDWVIGDDYEISAKLKDSFEEELHFEENIVPEESFQDADKLIQALTDFSGKAWYRGHSDASWDLKTTIAREKNPSLSLERQLRLEFENHTTFLDPISHPLGIAKLNFVMRHHGVPTRIMDWTTSPLVALYFAVCDNKKDGVDACIWILDPSQLNRFYKESFPLECLGEKEALYTDESDKILAIHAPYTNLRMRMQQSEFTLHTNYKPMEDMLEASVFLKRKIIISGKIKHTLRKKLKSMGIDKGFLFPDLDHIAEQVKENVLEQSDA